MIVREVFKTCASAMDMSDTIENNTSQKFLSFSLNKAVRKEISDI